MLPDANNYLIIVPKLARCDNSLMHYFLNYGIKVRLDSMYYKYYMCALCAASDQWSAGSRAGLAGG